MGHICFERVGDANMSKGAYIHSGWSRSGVHMTLHLEKKKMFSENF